jgi:ankyrin repeat protein
LEANVEHTHRLPQGGHTTTVIQVAAYQGAEKHICNECIKLCTEVLAEEAKATAINAPDEHGMTSLMHVVFIGNIRAIEDFLTRGPNIHHKDHQGRTALDIAVEEGHEQIIQLLKDAAAQ